MPGAWHVLSAGVRQLSPVDTAEAAGRLGALAYQVTLGNDPAAEAVWLIMIPDALSARALGRRLPMRNAGDCRSAAGKYGRG